MSGDRADALVETTTSLRAMSPSVLPMRQSDLLKPLHPHGIIDVANSSMCSGSTASA